MAGSLSLDDLETVIIEGKYAEAETLAKQFLSQNPAGEQRERAEYLLGLSFLYQEQFSRSREVFDKLVKGSLNSRISDKAAIGRIDSFLIEGQYSTALTEAQQLLKKNPRSEFLSLIYLKLARAHFKVADWASAKSDLLKIVKHFPNSPEYFTAKQLLEEKQFFTVQVGSFIDQQRAQDLVAELQRRGIYAYIIETNDKEDRHFYRVRIGELSTVSEAQKLKEHLASLGYPTQIYP
jgi:tetratricopeptide (TPR) repeat protein